MNISRLQYLFEKYFDKTISSDERVELADLLNAETNRKEMINLFSETWQKYDGDGKIISAEKSDEMLGHIIGATTATAMVAPVRKLKWWRIAAAAAILVFLVGGYLLVTNKRNAEPVIVNNLQNDVNPGSYKAKLTLADGSAIVLDSAGLGELAKQGNTSIVNKDAQLVYNPSGITKDVLYNTLSTAKGETYSMTLSDGSKVWLNSASSIRFPVAFYGNERLVETTGEVYIKVAKNTAQPFIASTNGMQVLALGTEFNINSYSDEEKISTTLIEGSVKVTNGGASAITLEPGQQTVLKNNGHLSAATTVNINEIIAWKDGWFHFESADLKTILRQFERWYDVEVIYEGAVKNRKFFTVIKRSSTLKNVLELLQDNDISYRIEGKKLFVKAG